MKQKSFDEEMKELFGGKVYRLSLSSGCSCPNRDGKLSTGGCIFCSAGGSGEFAAAASLPIDIQIEEAKKKVSGKLSKNFAGYMAYFQSFTNTYGPAERLQSLFSQALEHPEVLALSIGTRPDCLPDDIIAMLAELNRRKPVWVELGLQTIHENTAMLCNRGYALPVFEDAVRRLKAAGIRVVAHVIIGLPGEGPEEVKQTIRYLASLDFPHKGNVPCAAEASAAGTLFVADKRKRPRCRQRETSPLHIDGVKLQVLQVLKGTELAEMKKQDPEILHEYTLEEYAFLLKELLDILPEDITVHRLTGDPPKSLLISPLWTADKKRVLNTIRRVIG